MRNGLIGWAKRLFNSPAGLYLLLTVIVALLTIHNISSRPAGLNDAGLAAQHASQNLSVIKNDPVNAPHTLLALGFHKIGLSWLTSLRLSSIFFALIVTWSLAYLLAAWFGRAIGFMGALLFMATPLFLITARQGSPEVMSFMIATITAVYIGLLRARRKDMGLILLFVVCGLSVYIPALAIWLISAAIICRKKLTDTLSLVSPPAVTVAILLAILLLIPLVLAAVNDWHIIRSLAPLPAHFAKPLTILKETVWMALAIFVKAPYHSDLLLARLPVLNIIQDALLIFGTYALWQAAPKKLLTLVAATALAIFAAGVNNELGLLALSIVPLAVVICAGLRYLYIEWLGIFPVNPVARGLAYTLLAAVVVIHILFGVRYAVVAWPVNASTKAAYVLK